MSDRRAGDCAGVDGCRGGWVVATRRGVHVVASIAEIIAADHAVIAIDMPIGLPATKARRSEVEARRFLSPRGSTIFPTPPRRCLGADDYREACELSVSARGVKLSKQSWHIMAKIAELDNALTATDNDRVLEAHPECSFVTMNDGFVLPTKHTAAGLERRGELVTAAFGVLPAAMGPALLHDVLDAYAVLWSAERFANGTHAVFPADGEEFDERGLAMRIVR